MEEGTKSFYNEGLFRLACATITSMFSFVINPDTQNEAQMW